MTDETTQRDIVERATAWPEPGKWPKPLTNEQLNYLDEKVKHRSDGDAWIIGHLIDEIRDLRGVDAFGWKRIPFGYNFWSADAVFQARIDYGEGVRWWAAKYNADGDLIDGADVTPAANTTEAKRAAEAWMREHGYGGTHGE